MSVNKLFDLSGHTALVTGSSRGIGRSIAAALAGGGANVAVHGSRESESLSQAIAEIKAVAENAGAKSTVAGFAADLSSAEEVKALPDRIRSEIGSVDILVLNASIQKYCTLEDFSCEQFDLEYHTNLRSAFLLIQAVLPGMKENKWGRILAIGSVNQWKPSERLPIYASGKSALVNLIMNCAKQYSSFGITSNNLAPGVIITDRNREALKDKEFSDKILSAIPAGRFGQPEDCAGTALLLCSDAGAYITGADIPVTGGMHL